MGTVFLLVLLLALLVTLLNPKRSRWGYGPPGILGLLLVIVILMIFMDVIPMTGWNWGRHPAAP